ncbi:MAG: hypothetical protein ACYC9O_02280 [Candidatus Latescibacterota bacterium]
MMNRVEKMLKNVVTTAELKIIRCAISDSFSTRRNSHRIWLEEKRESRDREPWFPARTGGTGWDLPHCWQGWTVIIGCLALLFGGIYLIDPSIHRGLCYGYLFGLTVLLILIIWAKSGKSS